MTWVKLDDQWADHPKIVGLPDLAQLLWVKGLTYACRHRTRGFIPAPALPRMLSVRNTRQLEAKLLQAGLWTQCEGGYQIHDFNDYQPTDELRAARAAAGRSGGVRSGEARRSPDEAKVKQVASIFEANGEANDEANRSDLAKQTRSNDARAQTRAGTGSGSGSDPEGSAEGNQLSEPVEPHGTAPLLPPGAPLTHPEALPRGQHAPPGGKGRPETGYDVARRVWSELWRAAYRAPYEFGIDTGPRGDDAVLQRLGALALKRGEAGPEAILRHKVKAYLEDAGDRGWLAENRHPLRLLERDWNKYPEPKAARPARPVLVKPPAPSPVSDEEHARRAAALVEAVSGAFGKPAGGARG